MTAADYLARIGCGPVREPDAESTSPTFAGAGVLTSLLASYTRRLISRTGFQPVQTERTLRGLTEEQYDAATLLTSATLNVDLILEALDAQDRRRTEPLESHVQALRGDLLELRTSLERMKEQASVQLLQDQPRVSICC